MSLPFKVVNPPATPEALARLSSIFGALPDSYLAILATSDGVECGIHDKDGDCLVLWPTGQLPKLNSDYEIQRWLPEVIVIGSDGGGEAIGFDRSTASDPELWPVVRIPF